MSETAIKPENVKRHRTREEYLSDKRFNRRLGWGVAVVFIVALVGIIWIVVEATTEPVSVTDHVPLAKKWGG